jgi:hypothetical protein
MYFKGGWSQFAEDHDLHQGFFMIFDYHVGTSKFDVKVYDCTQCQKEYEAEVHFQYTLLLCNLLLWLSFGVLSIISSCDEFYLVPSLLIDHGNESSFRGMLLIYYRVTLNRAFFCRISGCEQPSNMSQTIADTKSQ